MVQNIIFACIIVTALGALFGAGLSIAAKHFAVKKDEKLEALEAALPGYNCGSCGFAGCSGYAEAIFNGSVTELTKCAPGAAKSAARIAEIMGVAIDLNAEKMVAHCHCRGDNEQAIKAMNYKGIEDCNAAFAMFQGPKACKYGCLGFGSCIKVCPAGAITKTGTGLVQVDKDKCISCGACTKVCPTKAMRMIPISASHVVDCNSHDKGPAVKKACKVGCIGCKMCEKKSPEGGFVVDNFLASIDYSKTGERDTACASCPSKCIVDLRASK